ncbi:MAG: methyltransferase domain-containing protein [Cyclobacteriaceae bacterium]|nr:methyltransferase domain-containing protein [Cyclobacteriaceae bacterium]
MEETLKCPICKNDLVDTSLQPKDHTVSQELFSLIECPQCQLLVTSPRPDESELDRYYESSDYISHTNNGNTLLNQLYLLVRNHTLKQKLKLVRQFNPTHLADVGCGTGAFLSICQKAGIQITGVEPNTGARAKAESILQQRIYHSIEDLTQQQDVITLWHVLEHLPQLRHNLDIITGKLSSSGTLIIAVPNYQSADARKYKSYWAAYDVPRHCWHFSQQSMIQLAESYQLKVQQIVPMYFDSYYVSLLSEKYLHPQKSTARRMLSGAYQGLVSNMKARQTGQYSSLIYIFQK